jgi:transposase
MEVSVKRIDHLGLVAGICEDLGIKNLVDSRVGTSPTEEISCGEAVVAMIINGSAFTSQPLSLTPRFFKNKPLHLFFGREISSECFNRYKLGRTLDACYEYGCEALFAEIASEVCKQQNVDTRFTRLDTTTFQVSGEYKRDSNPNQQEGNGITVSSELNDSKSKSTEQEELEQTEEKQERAIHITHGFSKDLRPDLKQAVLELVTCEDCIPLMCCSWDGNASDTEIFKKRVKDLIEEFRKSDSPRFLIADSKLYTLASTEFLKQIFYITRIPATLREEQEVISEALEKDLESWQVLDEENRFFTKSLDHYGIAQRWIVVSSKEAKENAKKSVEKKKVKEREELEKALSQHQKKRFSCQEDAKASVKELSKGLKFHKISLDRVIEHKIYSQKGRPKKDQEAIIMHSVECLIHDEPEKYQQAINFKSCYVIGTNAPAEILNDQTIVEKYKEQGSTIEGSFRFLKDPYFFASSFFVKSVKRLMGLLMIMTLTLLVYSLAQRKLRAELMKNNETVPNQIKQETSTPTMRWVFQLFEGIELVVIKLGDSLQTCVTGLNPLHIRILKYFPPPVQKMYFL